RSIRPDDPMLLYNVGCIFSMLGLADAALDCLEKAAASGLTQKGWYEHDSNLDPVRSHSRFQELLKGLA
ncbi:MAG: adenylate/guanylate cyclase domain-containing protein, partial [Acidobacteriia bacterium]|nr:adenylate/guanylate cyclase domain-containing protein [Terriglobia bacterium]